ncbi:hypothetical protein PQB81_gp028 [Arthrobacter phage Kardesai]|nr:hypothetical protein PQB81_gp028 [Arthrobacter phage Kardesai]QXO12935.1 hypothetical protein SEA_KARDESAI_28 [Arthrobacter phage Kardesai]
MITPNMQELIAKREKAIIEQQDLFIAIKALSTDPETAGRLLVKLTDSTCEYVDAQTDLLELYAFVPEKKETIIKRLFKK